MSAEYRYNPMVYKLGVVMKILSLLLFMFVFTPDAFAKRVAFVVGNNDYLNLTSLKKAKSDALSVSVALEKLGFQVVSGSNLTRSAFNEKFRFFLSLIDAGDVALFYFSGHGVAVGGQNIILPIDVPKVENEVALMDDAHPVDLLLSRIKDKGADTSILILDACRNNPFPVTRTKSIGQSKGLMRINAPPKTFILLAAGSGQEALDRLSDDDSDPNSVFTRSLLPLLSEPGLTLTSIGERLQIAVQDTAKTIQHDQVPAIYSEGGGRLVLLQGEVKPIVSSSPATFLYAPVDNAKEEFNAIKDIGSISLLEAFIVTHKNSSYANYAKLLVDDLRKKHEVQKKPEIFNQSPPIKSSDTPARKVVPVTSKVAKGWVVVLGSFPKSEGEQAQDWLNVLSRHGVDARIIDTDQYMSFSRNLYAVVLGPFSKEYASRKSKDISPRLDSYYIKELR